MIPEHEIDDDLIMQTVDHAIDAFYQGLFNKVDNIKLKELLKRKNPYLFYAKNIRSVDEIVDNLLSATISSSEETIFGNEFFEPIAIAASGGHKAGSEGVDIEIVTNDSMIVIAVKSGPSVFNADSRKRQEQNFQSIQKRAQQGKLVYYPIIGYGYGKKAKKADRPYTELYGQEFWEAITGDSEFYLKILDYMSDKPRKYREEFTELMADTRNRLIRDFSNQFCNEDGSIDWVKLLKFNSGKEE